MYLCICKAVTTKQMQERVQQKGGDTKSAMKSLGTGTCCGACVQETYELFPRQQSSKKKSAPTKKS